MNWVKITAENQPPPQRGVAVSFLNSHGKRHWTKATFYPAGTLMAAEDFADDHPEMVDENGCCIEANWYETPFNQDVILPLDIEPSHYALIEPPEEK